MLKNIKIGKILTLAIPILLISYFSIAAKSQSKNVNDDKIVQHIENATHKQYGKTVIKGKEEFKGKTRTIAEDTKFIYRIDENGKFATINAKNPNDFNINTSIPKQNIITNGEVYLQNYLPVSKNCKYVLDNLTDSAKSADSCYEFIFSEVASNGVKTGTRVSISISKNGDFAGLASYIGNPDIALSTNPKLSKEDALKIAIKTIKSKEYLKNINEIPKEKSELTVYDNRLVWLIEIKGIKGNGTYNGFIFYIDAINGNIIFNDSYTTINN